MRRWVLVVLSVAAGAVLALAALPWWITPVIRLVGRHYGATFSRYERVGYSRFAIYDIAVRQPGVLVTASRAEADTPVLWLAKFVSHRPRIIDVGRWRVDAGTPASPPPSPRVSTKPGGAMPLRALLFRLVNAFQRWLPDANIGPGVVAWPGSELVFSSARLTPRALDVPSLRYRTFAGNVGIRFSSDTIDVAVRGIGQPAWHAELQSVRDQISGKLSVWDQPATLAVTLPATGWMPDILTLNAREWNVPPSGIRLETLYTTVRGSAELDWRRGAFSFAASVDGDPVRRGKAPPLTARIRAGGNLDRVDVDEFQVHVPGIDARLSAPWSIQRGATGAPAASHLAIEADLAKQTWIAGRGRVSADATLTTRAGAWPLVAAAVEAHQVSVQGFALEQLRADFILDWPRLEARRAYIQFHEGGDLNAQGQWDFSSRTLTDAHMDGVVRPSLVSPWLPAGISFQDATVSIRAHGPAAALEHEGSIHVSKISIHTTSALDTTLAWLGTGTHVDVKELTVRAGASRITAAGTVDDAAAQVNLTQLQIYTSGALRLGLEHPVSMHWRPALQLDSLALSAGTSRLAVTLAVGRSGSVTASVQNFASAWLRDFIVLPGPEWSVSSLDLQGKWNDGPLDFRSQGAATVALDTSRSAQVALEATGDARGLKIATLRVAEADQPIVDAHGELPIVFDIRGTPRIELNEKGPLSLEATTEPNAQFWQRFTEATGVELKSPELTASVSGTFREPRGSVRVKAERIAVDPARIKFRVPTVTDLDAQATADHSGLQIPALSVRVEGQAVRLQGTLPLTADHWAEFRKAPVQFIREGGTMQLEIADADVAAIAKYFPQYIAPSGRLHLDVAVKAGGDMTGSFRLAGAAMRPLGPLGVLQEIQVDARIQGRSVEIIKVAAQIGGQPLALTGKVEMPVGAAPRFFLALDGKNLPIIRQTGLLLRADVGLRLETAADGVPRVTGVVGLRDSVFLSDVRAFIPSGGAGGPMRRPPYFSVDTPPLDHWRLGVDIRGDHFLRLRSTVFVGVASARFRLDGTLGEPRATGDLSVESGQVLLPFASFDVTQGSVRLTEADPNNLLLSLTGTARRYGYDLRLDLDGTVAKPQVTFTSSPPLEARQVFLLVTAGETPNDEINYGTTQRATRIGTYLGQTLLNSFGGDATQPDRLSITTGERVSLQGRETYDVEYRLTNRLTLVGEYDEFDDYNAGIKWKLEDPKKTKSAAPPPPPAPDFGKDASNAPAR